jgi:biopolymer transport protein ExbB
MIGRIAKNLHQGLWNSKRMSEINLGIHRVSLYQAASSIAWALACVMFVSILGTDDGWAELPSRPSSTYELAASTLAPFANLHGQDPTTDSASGSATAGSPTSATESAADPVVGDEDTTATPHRSMLQMMFTGNWFGVVIVVLILLLSLLSCILIVENAISLRRSRLLPPDVMQALESALALRDTRAAMMICNDIDNHSMATQVVLAGLERFRSSEFGFAEYRSAVEEAGEHITGRLYRKVEILNVIASIAPMLGLTGTVIGMIDAFNTIAAKQGVAGPEDLAGGIGQALITTLLGLVVAIPTMVAFSYFRTKIDALVSEAGTRIERLMLPLGRRKSSP